MSDLAIAEFLVARERGQGYCVRRFCGAQADRLSDRALRVLDIMGPIRPGGHGTIDAWLGPIGGDDTYVRVQVRKGDSETLYYWQVWFSKDRLPKHPADVVCSLKAPDQPSSIVDRVRQVFESGESLLYRYPPETEALEFCRAITRSWQDDVARRVTWITDTESRDIPVHLRLGRDSSLTSAGTTSVPRPIPQSKPPKRHSRDIGRRMLFYLTAVVVLLSIGFFAGASRLSSAWPPGVVTADGETSEHERNATKDSPSQSQPEITMDIAQLKTQLRRSSKAAKRLRDLLGRPHVAAAVNAPVIDLVNTVEIRITHDVAAIEAEMGNRDERVQRFRSTEARQLLDLLHALDHVGDH